MLTWSWFVWWKSNDLILQGTEGSEIVRRHLENYWRKIHYECNWAWTGIVWTLCGSYTSAIVSAQWQPVDLFQVVRGWFHNWNMLPADGILLWSGGNPLAGKVIPTHADIDFGMVLKSLALTEFSACPVLWDNFVCPTPICGQGFY